MIEEERRITRIELAEWDETAIRLTAYRTDREEGPGEYFVAQGKSADFLSWHIKYWGGLAEDTIGVELLSKEVIELLDHHSVKPKCV